MEPAVSSIDTIVANQWECQHLFLTFMQCLDAGEAERAVALLSPDVIWHRQGKKLIGPEAVRAAICERPANRLIRHFLSNIVVTIEQINRARSVAYYAVYTRDGNEQPRTVGGPERVGDYHAGYVRGQEGWRIAYLRAERLFTAGGHG